jgi:hypothetical protein
VAASKRILVEAPDLPAAERLDRQREINEPVRSSETPARRHRLKEKRAPALAEPLAGK